ncbi:conserved membrane hypothetical protein [Clostridiaceae bacterium BL-3]|nr:conserved membrane hypothetical protein [Clostridiaceae bacterium BL-3]
MLKLQWIEIFLRCIPEMLLIIWGIYVLARKSFNVRNYIILSCILGLYSFLVRELPIYFGVHTIIITISIISIMIIQGIPLVTSIYSTLAMLLILMIGETLNKLILSLFNISFIFTNIDPVKKSILTLPSLIILFLSIIIIQNIVKKNLKIQ